MSDYYQVREDSERKYFAMIPNFIDDLGLSQKAYRLYGHLKRLTGEKGRCLEGVDAMASKCGMAKNSIIASKRELVKHGLISIKVSQGRTRPDEIVILDVWKQNNEHFEPDQKEERVANEVTPASQTEERDASQTRERKKSKEEEYREAPTDIYSRVVQDCLILLAKLDGYPKNTKGNAEHLGKLCKRHSQLDIRRQVEKFCWHYEEQGFERGQKPRARLATWLSNAEDWNSGSQQNEPFRRKKKRVSV